MKNNMLMLALLLCAILTNAQTPSITCDYTSTAPSPPLVGTQYSYNGLCHTPKGNLNILVVFIGFNGTTSADDVTGWAHDQIPTWASGADNPIFNKTVGTFIE